MSQEISMIMRQTNYSEEVAKNKLNQHNNNIMKVIEEYMGIKEEKKAPMVSVNQEKYNHFRKLMDSAEQNYRERNNNS
jgi:hypothetical protein